MCICFLVAFSICLHVCPAHKSGPGVPGGPGNIEPNQQEAPETRISDLWDYPSGNPRAQSAFSTIASCSIFATVCQYLPENRRGTVCQYFVPWPHRAIELLGTGLRSNSSLSSILRENFGVDGFRICCFVDYDGLDFRICWLDTAILILYFRL